MAQYGVFLYGTELYGQAVEAATYLNNIAKIVGGTQPDATKNPYFYSGARVGDGTGVAGIKGCYSRPPFVVEEAPCGIVFTGRFRSTLDINLERQDEGYRLVVLVKKVDSRSDFAILNKFRDSIPAAFRGHITLLGAQDVVMTLVSDGRAIGMEYAGEKWWAWEYTVSVLRLPNQQYVTH